MSKQVCSLSNPALPANIVGPFKQTLFLGCSVKSFTSSVGWNEQESSLNIELIEDPCAPADGSLKYYYPKPGIVKTWNLADPGFQSPTVGAPVYFRVEDFEFAGIVQSWSKKDDSSNYPTYSVTLSDPRFLLENMTIIAGEYAGEVKDVPNLVNAYGWLESISPEVCLLDDNLECRPCTLDSTNFPDDDNAGKENPLLGSPADGFGGANENDQGVPWVRLQEAIQILLSGNPHPKYSPKGYAQFKGHSILTATGPSQQQWNMGRIKYDKANATLGTNFNSNGKISEYYVDISEIPFAPTYYRISATSQSLLSIISQVCQDAGCDFYIELIVTKNLDKVIKVRTVKRRAQPNLGEIEAFLNTNNDYLISKNVGRELRNEPTSVFLYGANLEQTYEVVPTGANGQLGLDYWVGITGLHECPVEQHWGFDSKGAFQEVSIFSGDRYHQEGLLEHDVLVDILPLQNNLSKPIKNLLNGLVSDYSISETEFRMAMGSFDAWLAYTCFVGITGTDQDLFASDIGTVFGRLLKQDNNFGKNIPMAGLSSKLKKDNANALTANSIPNVVKVDASGSFAKPVGNIKKDLEAIHSFIKAIGDANYGRKYVVKVPEICYYKDAGQSRLNFFSDTPTSAAFPPSGISGVLDLKFGSTGIERFEEENTAKIKGIARYYMEPASSSMSGDFKPKGDDYIRFNSGLYSPLSVDSKNYLFPTGGRSGEPVGSATGVVPAVIVEVGTPIFSGKPKQTSTEAPGDLKSSPAGTDALGGEELVVKGDWFGQTLKSCFAVAPQALPTSGFAIPILSNTQRYGPWGYIGPPGPVRFEEDTDLAPWNYNGYDLMTSGAIEKVADGLTFMQAGERGGFTLVGYPQKALGQDLRSPQKSWISYTLTNATTNYGTYKYLPTTPMDGTFGPNITSLNVSIGEGGATTTYELATFTPSFGRMSKLNANRIKEIAKLRAERKKQERENKKIAALANKGASSDPSILQTIKEHVKGFIGNENMNQVKNLMMGRSSTLSSSENNDEDLALTAGADNQIFSKQSARSDDIFSTSAVMSQEGMFRPVSKAGDGDLPGYDPQTAIVTGNEAHSVQPDGPFIEWTKPVINASYLDPLASSGQAKHSMTGDMSGFHDILQVGFGTSLNQSGGYGTTELRDYVAQGNSCPDDFRFLALRGPLVINGWGYDLQGKPIPNEVDSPNSARSGEYAATGLTDKFMNGWLKKSKTWPVAPVDLRYDRDRGVWTVPNSFRIVHCRNTGSDIGPGLSGEVQVLNPAPVYDTSGNLVPNTGVHIVLHNVPSTNSISGSGSGYVNAYYDTNDHKWYTLGSSVHASSGDFDPKNPKICVYNTGCVTGTYPSRLNYLDSCKQVEECVGKVKSLYFGDNIKVQSLVGYEDCCSTDSNAHIELDLPIAANATTGSWGSQFTACTSNYTALNFVSGFELYHDNNPEGGCPVINIALDPAIGSGMYGGGNNTCPAAAAVALQPINKIFAQDGLEVAVAAKQYSIKTIHKLEGATFRNLNLRSGLKATAYGGNCDYYIDVTGMPPCFNISGSGGITVSQYGECGWIIGNTGSGLSCDDITINGGRAVTVTKSEESCTFTVDYEGCTGIVLNEGANIQITENSACEFTIAATGGGLGPGDIIAGNCIDVTNNGDGTVTISVETGCSQSGNSTGTGAPSGGGGDPCPGNKYVIEIATEGGINASSDAAAPCQTYTLSLDCDWIEDNCLLNQGWNNFNFFGASVASGTNLNFVSSSGLSFSNSNGTVNFATTGITSGFSVGGRTFNFTNGLLTSTSA